MFSNVFNCITYHFCNFQYITFRYIYSYVVIFHLLRKLSVFLKCIYMQERMWWQSWKVLLEKILHSFYSNINLFIYAFWSKQRLSNSLSGMLNEVQNFNVFYQIVSNMNNEKFYIFEYKYYNTKNIILACLNALWFC